MRLFAGVAALAFIVGELVHDVGAQNITVPNTFVNGTVADATQVNANFAALAANALNRNGGTLAGDTNPDADNTRSLGTNALRFANIRAANFAGTGATFTGTTFTGGTFTGTHSGDGSALTALNATQATTGTLPNARLNTGQPMWTIATTTSTGTQNDFAPGLSGHTFLRCNNASLLTINGFASGVDGQILVVESIGAGQVDLAHQNAGSSAGNRLVNFVTSASTSLAGGVGIARYRYDATTARWRLLEHEQGGWITATYAVGNFTGSGAWTVDAGDITTMAYWLKGRTLTVCWYMGTTTITTGTTLNILNGAWGGFTVAKTMLNAFGFNDNGTGNAVGLAQSTAADTKIQLLKTAGANWATETNNTGMFGEIVFEVQ